MVIKNLCILALLMKVALALEGLTCPLYSPDIGFRVIRIDAKPILNPFMPVDLLDECRLDLSYF